MEKRIQFCVGEEEEMTSLGKFLSGRGGLTKKQISQAKFRKDGILVNGRQSRTDKILRVGDQVEVLLENDQKGSEHLVCCKGEAEVLYEDEDLLIVNKPAGIAVHPGKGHYADTIANILMGYYEEKGLKIRIRPVGRLDLETSGVLVFSKNQVSAGRLAKQKKEGTFYKDYLAIAQGCFDRAEGTINRPIGPSLKQKGKMQVLENGKKAVTRYQVKRSGENSVVQVQIDTGRTHQIRVHMASVGHPLLGDPLYGGCRDLIGRTALHAYRVTLLQPFTGETIRVEAELPKDMKKAMGAEQKGVPTY